MLILEIMLAIILTIIGVAFFLGICLGLCIVIVKIKNMIDDGKHARLQEKYPDYYQKLDLYNEKFAAASRFQLENIDNKKMEIDSILNEIKYLPDVHTTVQKQKVEQLKQEIYDNNWKYKAMSEECSRLNNELLQLRRKYNIDC